MVSLLREKYITPEIIQNKLDIYEPLIKPYLSKSPDADELTLIKWQTEFDILIPRLDENIANYRSELGHPMPFWQVITYEKGVLTLKWDESIDLQNDKIVYDLAFATNVADLNDSNRTIINEVALDTNGDKLDITSWGEISYKKSIDLDVGKTYYMRVIAKEKDNYAHYQIAFDRDVEVNDINYFGVLEFVVE